MAVISLIPGLFASEYSIARPRCAHTPRNWYTHLVVAKCLARFFFANGLQGPENGLRFGLSFADLATARHRLNKTPESRLFSAAAHRGLLGRLSSQYCYRIRKCFADVKNRFFIVLFRARPELFSERRWQETVKAVGIFFSPSFASA